ncbi:hypothetical protein [Chitinophaga silvatica]|nr:hypothetical protein [Chitinophaga silvatica]
MPEYSDHIHQSRKNLKFLEFVNNRTNQYYDWEVTTCYYVAVHLVNAHLSLHELQIRTHYDVMTILNQPEVEASIPGHVLFAYKKLQRLSRRSRYLVNERNANSTSSIAYCIHSSHLKKALEYLHTLIAFFKERYGERFEKIRINCSDVDISTLCYCEQMD